MSDEERDPHHGDPVEGGIVHPDLGSGLVVRMGPLHCGRARFADPSGETRAMTALGLAEDSDEAYWELADRIQAILEAGDRLLVLRFSGWSLERLAEHLHEVPRSGSRARQEIQVPGERIEAVFPLADDPGDLAATSFRSPWWVLPAPRPPGRESDRGVVAGQWITNHPKPIQGFWPRRQGVSYMEGAPKGTERHSAAYLREMGMVGVYSDMDVPDYRDRPLVHRRDYVHPGQEK